jgi:hypothetical protein
MIDASIGEPGKAETRLNYTKYHGNWYHSDRINALVPMVLIISRLMLI